MAKLTTAEWEAVKSKTPRAVWPTVSRIVTTSPSSQHNAIDIAGNIGDPVFAPVGGIVTAVKNQPGGYGLNVRVKTNDGKELIFAHLSGAAVRVGQRVNSGQPVGAVGNTGNSTGPHLHFEVRQPGPDAFAGGLSTTSALDPFTLLGLNAGNAPRGSTVRLRGSPATTTTSRAVPSNGRTQADDPLRTFGTPVVQRTPEGDFVINTPLGPIDVDFPWERIITLMVGIVLVLVAAFMLAKPAVKKIAPKAAKAALGEIPGVSVAQAVLE